MSEEPHRRRHTPVVDSDFSHSKSTDFAVPKQKEKDDLKHSKSTDFAVPKQKECKEKGSDFSAPKPVVSDFSEPKPVLRTRPGNIVKMRTVSEPPEVPPELLGMTNNNDEEDCPRLASVASVARQRRMSTAEEPHRRRHNASAGKHSFLLSMTADPQSSGTELRRSDSECIIRRPASHSLAPAVPPVIPGVTDSRSKHSPTRNHTTSARFDVGFADMTGRRDQMEDACAICGNFGGNPERNLFLLLDGHSGKEASAFASVRLPAILQVELEAGKPPEEALRVAFRKTHEALLTEAPHCGTTATALLFIGEKGYVAHVGDSRAVIVAEDCSLTRLTEDHRPSNEAEAQAVRARGGFIISLGGPHLRVNGVIAITRSLGDKSLEDALTCEPDVSEFTLPEKGTLVLACDGLWDVVTFVLHSFL